MFTLFVYSGFKFACSVGQIILEDWIHEFQNVSWLQRKDSQDAFARGLARSKLKNRVSCCVIHLRRCVFNSAAKICFVYIKDSSIVSRFQLQWQPNYFTASSRFRCKLLKRVQCAFVALHKASFAKRVLHWMKQSLKDTIGLRWSR